MVWASVESVAEGGASRFALKRPRSRGRAIWQDGGPWSGPVAPVAPGKPLASGASNGPLEPPREAARPRYERGHPALSYI